MANRKAKRWNKLKSCFLHFFAHIRCFIHHPSQIVWHHLLAVPSFPERKKKQRLLSGGNSPDHFLMLQSEDISFRGPATHICHPFLYMSITNDWSLEGSTHRPSYLRSRSSRASLPSTARADGTQCSSCSRYCGFRETCHPTESSPVQVKLGNSNKQKECAKV